jgi:hypothetical protein
VRKAKAKAARARADREEREKEEKGAKEKKKKADQEKAALEKKMEQEGRHASPASAGKKDGAAKGAAKDDAPRGAVPVKKGTRGFDAGRDVVCVLYLTFCLSPRCSKKRWPRRHRGAVPAGGAQEEGQKRRGLLSVEGGRVTLLYIMLYSSS